MVLSTNKKVSKGQGIDPEDRVEMFAARQRAVRRAMRAGKVESLLVTDLTNISYLTGFTGSSAYLLVTARGGWFFTDSRYTIQAGNEVCGFKVKILTGGYLEEVTKALGRTKVKTLSFEASNLTYDRWVSLKKALVSGITLKPSRALVEGVREIKDPVEIATLRRAIEIANDGYCVARRLLAKFDKGVTELDVSTAIERTLSKWGALTSFDTIVASGYRSALPHGKASNKKIRKGEFVIIDMGALYGGYHSDETRTFIIGKASARHREIYSIVKEAHDLAIQGVRPGIKASHIDSIARDFIKKAGYGNFFGHGTGHGTGLNVHEGPNISPKSSSIIKEGMVFTIEPGIYIPDFGGVRIEDMVLVTADGCEVLTKSSKEMESIG